VLRLFCALPVAGVLTGFAFLLLTGEYINDGPIVLDVSYNHGIHKGDLFVMAGWAVAMLSLLVLLAAPRGAHTGRAIESPDRSSR
jgi:hypothetical protein